MKWQFFCLLFGISDGVYRMVNFSGLQVITYSFMSNLSATLASPTIYDNDIILSNLRITS